MALQITVKNKKGIVTSYHQINSLEVNSSIRLKLYSYADVSYREIEKQRDKDVQTLKDLSEKLRNLTVTDETIDMIKGLSVEYNVLVEKGITLDPNQYEYALIEEEYTLPLDKESGISFEALYSQIKSLPQFKDAIDV